MLYDPKKGKESPRNIEVPTDTPTVCELGDTAADFHREEGGEREEERGSYRAKRENRSRIRG